MSEQHETTGLVTGRTYPSRPNRLGEEIGWIDLTRTCRHGHTQRMVIDERRIPLPPAGYCLTCWPRKVGRSPAPKWEVLPVEGDDPRQVRGGANVPAEPRSRGRQGVAGDGTVPHLPQSPRTPRARSRREAVGERGDGSPGRGQG